MSKARQLANFSSVAPDIGRRNLIINGAMQVAQRGTSKTGVTAGTYATVDRFQNGANNLGTWTEEQSTDSPNGFSNSFKLTCTTADATPAAGDYIRMLYTFEGQDLQQFAFGTSDAKNMTISFWIKSNKTGTVNTILRHTDANRIAGELVSINAADTWEYKTVTLNGDTSSGFNNDNQTSAQLQWWFNAGSTFTGGTISNSFQNLATNMYASNATLGLGGATSDYVAITGVQLEVGSVATPFEHRSYGEELVACQRYYQYYDSTDRLPAWVASASTGVIFTANCLQNPMRAQPSISLTAPAGFDSYYRSSYVQSSANVNRNSGSTRSVILILGNFSGMISQDNGGIYNTVIKIDAEL